MWGITAKKHGRGDSKFFRADAFHRPAMLEPKESAWQAVNTLVRPSRFSDINKLATKIMKSLTRICLALATALALSAYTAHAQTDSAAPGASTSTNKPVSPKPRAKGKPYAGTIDSVDKDAKTITVLSSSGTSKTYEITSKTRIKKDGQPATLDEINKGDKVRGMSHADPEDSSKWIATTVNIGNVKKTTTAPVSPSAPDSSK